MGGAKDTRLVGLFRCVDCEANAIQGDVAKNERCCGRCGGKFVVMDGIPALYPSGWALRTRRWLVRRVAPQ